MAKPALALCATARTSLPCRQGASVAHAGCGLDCSGLFVSGSGQMSEDILLTIRGGRNWIKLNATDIAVMYHSSWGPKQKDCLQAWAKSDTVSKIIERN